MSDETEGRGAWLDRVRLSDWGAGEHPMSDEARRQRDAMIEALRERRDREQARSGRPDLISLWEICTMGPPYDDGGQDP